MKTKPDFYEIDKNQLDREWVNQPKLYYKYARRLADSRAESEQAKTAADVARAVADAEIRGTPAKFGIEKVTEAAVAAAVITHPAYQTAVERMQRARHAVDIVQSAVTTLDHRKKALESLVDLRLADYFSEPRASRSPVDTARRRRQSEPETDDE